MLVERPRISVHSPVLICAFLAVVVSGWSPVNSVAVAQQPVDFANDIKPLLEKHCIRCHGPEDQQADFRIDEKDTVFNYLDPGDASFSDLFNLMESEDPTEMMPPPEEGGPLAEEEIELFRRWIDEGAEWPDTVTLEMPAQEVQDEIAEEIAEKKAEQDKQDSNLQLIWEIIGLLHPVLLHFPVAMLIGGAMFAIVGFRGESPLSDAAYYCLWLGALSAIAACASGWSFAVYKSYLNWQSFDFGNSIDIHRWGALLIAVLAFLLALVASGSRRRDPYGTGAFWKISLILLAGLTGFVAHHGGKLTHTGLHEELGDKTKILYESIAGQSESDRMEKETQQQENEAADVAGATDENQSGEADKADESGDSEKPGNAETSGETDSGDESSGDEDG